MAIVQHGYCLHCQCFCAARARYESMVVLAQENFTTFQLSHSEMCLSYGVERNTYYKVY